MSEMQQQIQPQQQPVLAYPNTAAASQSPPHHTNGSFGAVFIVLAVIIVISGIACFLGRLCNRRVQSQKPKPQNHNSVRPKGKEPSFHPTKEGDIEFGFDMKNPNGKLPSGNGGSKGTGKGKGVKPFENGGEMRNEFKHPDGADFKFPA